MSDPASKLAASWSLSDAADPLVLLKALHARVDGLAAELASQQGAGITCHAGCSSCCIDGQSVGAAEALAIAKAVGEAFPKILRHAPGACVLLSAEGRCQIYAHRPYRCRTQGLPLAYWEETESLDQDADEEDLDNLRERRAICERNTPRLPLDALPVAEVWSLGPIELVLQTIDRRIDSSLPRIALRALAMGEEEQPGGFSV